MRHWAHLRWQLFLDKQRKTFPDWSVAHHQEQTLFLVEWMFHVVAAMRRREIQCHMRSCPHSHQSMMAKETAPFHPSVKSLLELTEDEILGTAEEVYHGWYEVLSSILPQWHQDELMVELHEELGQHLTRAGLQDIMARSLSKGRRHSHAGSLSWAPSPSVESRRKEVAKWPRGDSMTRHSQPRSRHTRSRAQQQQSQSPEQQQPSEASPWASPRRPPRHVSLPLPHHAHSLQMTDYTAL